MVIIIVPPDEIPLISGQLLALFDAQSQAALDTATAAIVARTRPAEPEPETDAVGGTE